MSFLHLRFSSEPSSAAKFCALTPEQLDVQMDFLIRQIDRGTARCTSAGITMNAMSQCRF
jgi:hypothetical protein